MLLVMDKSDAVKRAGSITALAAILGLTRQAVSKWKEIPQLQLYRLRELRPRWFRKPRQ
jgi:hypothetical protein